MSRRCTQRQYLLRPDDETKQIYEYCLAEAATRFAVQTIAWLAMSNHHHLVAYDEHGNLPAFLAHFHKMLAKVMNARWGRWENLFSVEQVNIVRCVDVADALDKVVYTLANPVRDHLVDEAHRWPSASAVFQLDGRAREIARPKIFFRERGKMPENVGLIASVPAAWRGTDAAWFNAIRAGVRKAEAAARQHRARTGAPVVGPRALQALSPHSSPSTAAPRRQLRPLIASQNPVRRREALLSLRVFREAYARARAAYVSGVRDVLFPAGTYLMRLLGVPCAPFGTEPLCLHPPNAAATGGVMPRPG